MTLNLQSVRSSSIRLYEAETSPDLIAERYGLDRAGIVDFSLNVNPFGSPPGAIAAARDALDSANLYPDLDFGPLRKALAARHGVTADCLFFGAGLDDVIKLLIQAWTTPGDNVLVHIPTFPRYELEARIAGCSVVCVENERPEEIDLAGIGEKLASGNVALAFLCTPNNPTGATVGNVDISRLARSAPDTILIVDEALIYPREDGAIPLVGEHANICVLRTFSKYFGLAGLRIGYAVAPERLLRAAEAGRPPFNMATAAMQAATAALADEQFLPACKAAFEAEVAHFRQAISGRDDIAVRGGNANMLLLDLGGRDAPAVSAALAAQGIVVADATSFRGLERHNMLRVSLRGRADNLKLISALETMR